MTDVGFEYTCSTDCPVCGREDAIVARLAICKERDRSTLEWVDALQAADRGTQPAGKDTKPLWRYQVEVAIQCGCVLTDELKVELSTSAVDSFFAEYGGEPGDGHVAFVC